MHKCLSNINAPLVQNSKGLHVWNEASIWWFNKLDASESLLCLV